MLEDGVEDHEQFAHTSGQGHLFGFTGRQQLLVKVADDRVMAAAHQRFHIEDGPHSGASTPDGALAPQGATVTVERSPNHQGGDLAVVHHA